MRVGKAGNIHIPGVILLAQEETISALLSLESFEPPGDIVEIEYMIAESLDFSMQAESTLSEEA